MAFKGVLRWSEGRWIAVAWQGGFALLAPSAGLRSRSCCSPDCGKTLS